MSFKETVLPDFVLAELYPASLSGKIPAPDKTAQNNSGRDSQAGEKSALQTGGEIKDSQTKQATAGADSKTTQTGARPVSIATGGDARTPQTGATRVSPGAGGEGKDLPYKFLGKNQKRVSVIARYAEDPYIPEEHLQFLVKILAACKLNLGDVAILNDATAAIQTGQLKAELDPAVVLLFGVEPVEIGLPLSFPLLRPQSFDGSHYLTIPPIATLLDDTDNAKSLKKQLWDSLKKMFGV